MRSQICLIFEAYFYRGHRSCFMNLFRASVTRIHAYSFPYSLGVRGVYAYDQKKYR